MHNVQSAEDRVGEPNSTHIIVECIAIYWQVYALFPSVYRYFVFILFISLVYYVVYQLKCVGGGYSDGGNIIIVIIDVVSYELPTYV